MGVAAARTSAASPKTPCCIASCENTLRRLRIPDCGLRIERMEEAQLMTKDELKRRTRQFALDVIRLVELLPRSRTTEVLGK
jgi:hypothetical protein